MTSSRAIQNQKLCCATFYEQPEIPLLFGEILHPGGADLSLELANRIKIRSSDIVLDIASGLGSTSSLLAQKFACRTVGVDLSLRSLHEAYARTTALKQYNSFVYADGESLPFPDAAFDSVISECSLCTFPSKEFAAKEIFRVLDSGGRAGISDVFLEKPLPVGLRDALYNFLCIADARSCLEYENLFEKAGFLEIRTYDRGEILLDMLDKSKKVLFAAELLAGLKKIPIAPDKVQRAKLILQEVTAAAKEGVISYGILTAKRANS